MSSGLQKYGIRIRNPSIIPAPRGQNFLVKHVILSNKTNIFYQTRWSDRSGLYRVHWNSMDDYLVDIAVYANRTQTFRTEKSSWRAPASSANRPQSELIDAMSTAPSHWVYSVSSLANIFKVFESSGWVHQSVVMPFLQQSLENQDLTPHQKSILIDAITER